MPSLDQPLGEVGVVAGALAADADVLAARLAGLDGHARACFLTAGSRSSKPPATSAESRSRPRVSWVMSLEPMEKPSKWSRNSSASTALDGISHIMIDLRPFSPRSQAVLGQQVDDALGLGQGAHERDHHLDVGQAHLVADVASAPRTPWRSSRRSPATGTARRRGSRSSGSPRAARSAGPPSRLAYSLDLKSRHPHDHRVRARTRRRWWRRPRRRAGRRSRAGWRRRRSRSRSARPAARSAGRPGSSSALGWMPIWRLMMNSSRARPDAGVGQPGERERLVRGADVHHDLDRDLGHRVELGLLDGEVEQPVVDEAGVALGAGDGHLAAVGERVGWRRRCRRRRGCPARGR